LRARRDDSTANQDGTQDIGGSEDGVAFGHPLIVGAIGDKPPVSGR
jgi:hypothetical protein